MLIENEQIKEALTHHDSFDLPPHLCRVTAGAGGESILIFSDNKTVLHDCGMAYCHHGLVSNIEKALKDHNRDSLDYILLSHTHYDHVGALPYVLQRWPEATVFGAEKAKKIFASEGAKRTMKRLGEAARDSYSTSTEEIITDGLRVDVSLEDNKIIPIGTFDGQPAEIVAISTPGHTDCSYSYLLKPFGLLFTSESTGIPRPFGDIHTSILKSYHDTIASAEHCKSYQASQLLVPHYGMLPEELVSVYFDIYIEFAEMEKNFILSLYDQGKDFNQIMEAYETLYWSQERSKGQPKDAFLENAKHIIKHILEVFRHA